MRTSRYLLFLGEDQGTFLSPSSLFIFLEFWWFRNSSLPSALLIPFRFALQSNFLIYISNIPLCLICPSVCLDEDMVSVAVKVLLFVFLCIWNILLCLVSIKTENISLLWDTSFSSLSVPPPKPQLSCSSHRKVVFLLSEFYINKVIECLLFYTWVIHSIWFIYLN